MSIELDKRGLVIRDMFAGVAPRYDLLNRVLSGCLDLWWRRQSAKAVAEAPAGPVLDLCAGTGDQACAIARRGRRVIAADFCLPMLVPSPAKFARMSPSPRPIAADALAIPFPDRSFAAVTISFGLRNVADPATALDEIHRILVPRGLLSVLEFAIPEGRVVRPGYLFYFRRVLPLVGRILSPRGNAYDYLARSVPPFHQRSDLIDLFSRHGLVDGSFRDLSSGIVCLYTARRAP